MSYWKEALVQTQDTHWRDYIAWQAWEHLSVPLDKLEEVAKEREVWTSLLSLCNPAPNK